MPIPNYKIIEAGPEWADHYRWFCQKAYSAAYVKPERGITNELFSKEVFSSPRVKQYFDELFARTDNRKIWLAIGEGDQILGGVVATKYPDYCEMKTFYVLEELQGEGIGSALYQKVKDFAGQLPMQVDVVEYMQDTINMYKHWGFAIDESKGKLTYTWDEWPEEIRHSHKGIYMVRPVE